MAPTEYRGSKDLFTGAVLQCVEAASLGLPFEVWKTRMGRYRTESTIESFKSIYRVKGVLGFWQGMNAKMIESGSKGAVLLYFKELLLNTCQSVGLGQTSSGFIAGAGAGISQTIVLGPCTLAVTSLVISNSNLPLSVRFQNLYRERGIKGFYSGGTAIAMRQATNWASRQGITECIRHIFLTRKSKRLEESLDIQQQQQPIQSQQTKQQTKKPSSEQQQNSDKRQQQPHESAGINKKTLQQPVLQQYELQVSPESIRHQPYTAEQQQNPMQIPSHVCKVSAESKNQERQPQSDNLNDPATPARDLTVDSPKGHRSSQNGTHLNYRQHQGSFASEDQQLPIQPELGIVRLSVGEEILSGILGGILSTWNQPFEVARIQMQSNVSEGGKSVNIFRVWDSIIKNDGVSGLFKGIIPRMGLSIWQTLFMVTGAKLIKPYLD